MKLDSKTVLVTGASSGLGRGIALDLARRSCNLVLTARREAHLREVATEAEGLGATCLIVPADATVAAQSQGVIDAGIERFGRIHGAVLNAGGGSAVSMSDATVDDVLWTMRTNFDTLATFLSPLIAHMKGHDSLIAYTGSPAGYFGLPKSGPYSASKAAGRVLIDTCRIELAGSGIEFVTNYPGFTYTEGLDADEIPAEWLIIQPERAVKQMVRAMERGWAHNLFPKRIKYPTLLGRMLPEPIRRRILATFG